MAAFHQHKGHIVLPQFSDDEINAVSTTGNRKPFNSVAGGNIQRCFGHIGINTKWIWQTHYCPFLLMRYGVRTTVRVSDEWLSVCAICLHMGLNPKGHQLHTLCQICSLLMITKNPRIQGGRSSTLRGAMFPVFHAPIVCCCGARLLRHLHVVLLLSAS